MTKLQTILSLFVFLVIVFSMDIMIFGNSIRETFSGRIGISGGSNIGFDDVTGNGMGKKLDYVPPIRMNTKNGDGSGFLGVSDSYPKGDDQPLFFGFSSA